MKYLGKTKMFALLLVCSFTATNALATNSYKSGHSSSCHNGDGNSAPDTASCDTWQGAQSYDMYIESSNSQNIDHGYDTSGSTVVVDGVGIQVSAWSDTASGYDVNGHYSSDDIVVGASFAGPWSNGTETGYGIINSDEQNSNNSGYSHAIDNLSGYIEDYDMVLFSFSEEVSLAGATFSWLGGNTSTQQVTVVGLNDISGLIGGSSTWESINGSAAVVSANSFTIENCDDVYVSDFTTVKTAQYWLVGAYNTAFGYVSGFTQNDDAFKLASIGFTKKENDSAQPPTGVNAPGSFAILMLGGGFIAWRKRTTI